MSYIFMRDGSGCAMSTVCTANNMAIYECISIYIYSWGAYLPQPPMNVYPLCIYSAITAHVHMWYCVCAYMFAFSNNNLTLYVCVAIQYFCVWVSAACTRRNTYVV
jgi:hypothetical protein